MDTQLDELTIKSLLNPLRFELLRLLKEKIHERKRENWFEIYLAIFIIMNNVEWLVADVVDYASRHVLPVSHVLLLEENRSG